MNLVDPRVSRTRKMLVDALIELIVEKGYEFVTIRDIVQKAKVNRSTFYLHYREKQDIFMQMEDGILTELAESVRNPTFTYETALDDYKRSQKPIQSAVTFFQHIQKYASLYRTLLVKKDFRERVTGSIRTELLHFSPSPPEAAFVSHGLVGLILYWLEAGMTESVLDMSLWVTRASLFPLGHFE